jgi:hypothetical protein
MMPSRDGPSRTNNPRGDMMKLRLTVVVAILCLFSVSAFAGEGMWMPDQVQLFSEQLGVLGLKLDPASFSDLTGFPMGAVISLGGCTASFVSPQGLVVTNHHCAFGSIQHNSTPENDLITNGFLAKTMGEELQASPGSRVYVTTAIEDVTEQVLGKIDPKLSDAKRYDVIESRTKKMIADCEKPGDVRCRVASFFSGAQYMKTTQLEIRDVRLVYAPARGIGNFGDEIDNFMWPRHVGDFSFYRAYVGPDGRPADYSADNKPYQPKHFLKVTTKDMNDGDLVIVAGYPGRTSRYLTAAEFAYQYETRYPKSITYFKDLIDLMADRGRDSKEARILLASREAGYENALKNYQGTLDGMKRYDMLGTKKKQTAELEAWIAATPERSRKYGPIVAEIDALHARDLAMAERNSVMMWMNRASSLLSQAGTIYRLALEKQKKDMDREPGFQERDLPRIKAGVERTQRQYEPGYDRAAFRYFLIEASKLPEGQRIAPVDEMMKATGKEEAGAQADAILDRLYAETKMASVEERRAMLDETAKQLEARKDPFLHFAAGLYPLVLESEKEQKSIDGALSKVRPLYLEALREMKGGAMYPDANSTLRVTLGTVEGYSPRDGVVAVPQTKLSGVVAKETGVEPFDSPKALLEVAAAKRVDGYVDPELGDVPVNFLSNVDTTGGNSGSPTLNKDGELCGLLFDGVWESIASDYVFVPAVTRSIHVDATYMRWVMDYVDGAHNLLEEMGLPVHSK